METITIDRMSDSDLIAATISAATDERRATAELLALLGELDKRRLYLGQGCASLFTFCTQVLRLSEHAAYHRIEVARAARQFPVILELVAEGSVTLTTVALLRSHLTRENHMALLHAAQHKSKREVEHQVACLAPRADVATITRRIAAPMAPTADLISSMSSAPEDSCVGRALVKSESPAQREPATMSTRGETAARNATPSPRIAPLSENRYLLRITVSSETHARLRRAQDLMRHTVPNGDPAEVVDRALRLLVDHLEKAKLAAATRPRSSIVRTARAEFVSHTRHIPSAVKRRVWERDQGRCAFVGNHGRCTETGRLEYHHVIPFARGGPNTPDNIALRCRAHNSFESDELFGAWTRM